MSSPGSKPAVPNTVRRANSLPQPARIVMAGFSRTVGGAELENHRHALGELTGMSLRL